MKKTYLLSSLLAAMFVSMPVSADVIGMRTAATVGDKLTIALNENVKATLTWGDGSEENLTFYGGEVEISVKHSDLTLSSDQQITRLYCPDCALTDLKLGEAPNLRSLICPNNQLAELDITQSARMVELNCESNQLTKLNLSETKLLENVNVSNNKLKTLGLSSLSNLTSFLCANNELSTLSLYNSKKLETLWCQGNNINSLYFASAARPVQICAFNNQLETLKPELLSEIKELWIDNNKLETLDLSSSHIETLSASDNLLKLITLNKQDQKSLQAFYVDGNELMFNSFPEVYKMTTGDTIIAYNIDNQRPYVFVESINVNEKLNTEEPLRRNAWGDFARTKLVWKNAKGEELVKGEDFKASGSNYTFLKPFSAVVGESTSPYYPGVVLRFADIHVVDPTGIGEMNVEDELEVSANANVLTVSAPQATVVRIYNVSGALVVNKAVSAGTYHWTLSAGLYVVNGKKVVIGH